MNLSIFIESLGCSKNLIDAEIMLGLLNKHGYRLTGNHENADVIIVNTCGFIQSAKEESINRIIELGLLKEKKLKLLIVSGCLGERYSEELLKEMPEIDAIVGTGNYDKIIEVINESLQGKKVVYTGDIDKIYDESHPRLLTTPRHSAYIKISDGCNNHCTYCIIPKLRGRYRSRQMEYIIQEAKNYASKGVKEIILIAQDTTRYGIDLYGKFMLPELLRKLNEIEDIKWIRILYAYPEAITDELIDTIATCEKVCNYIDMPIQHCSDEILKRMNRRTNKRDLIKLIDKLRKRIPDIVLRTTLIVGFPGETEVHFKELKEFVENIKFDRLGVFTYSKEEGTPASRLSGQVSEKIKEKRQKEIMEIQQGISYNKNQEKVGSIVEVLIEEAIEQDREYLGRTYGDAPDIDGLVYVRSNTPAHVGDIMLTRISGALEYDLIGENIDEFSK